MRSKSDSLVTKIYMNFKKLLFTFNFSNSGTLKNPTLFSTSLDSFSEAIYSKFSAL